MFSILSLFLFIIAGDVRVYIWNPLPIVGGSGTFGHASIGVGDKYLSFGKGHAVPRYSAETSIADNVFRLDHTQLDTENMKKKIDVLLRQTDRYRLYEKNCSRTTAEVLNAGGMKMEGHYVFNTGGTVTSPSELRNELISRFCERLDRYIVAVGVLGWAERQSLQQMMEKGRAGFKLISEGIWRQTYCVVAKKGWNL